MLHCRLQAVQMKAVEEWDDESPETHIETSEVEWTSDDPDPVAISRLKKIGETQGILEERARSLQSQDALLISGSI